MAIPRRALTPRGASAPPTVREVAPAPATIRTSETRIAARWPGDRRGHNPSGRFGLHTGLSLRPGRDRRPEIHGSVTLGSEEPFGGDGRLAPHAGRGAGRPIPEVAHAARVRHPRG